MKIDMSEWDVDKLDGPNFPEYGSYHFQVQKVEEEDAETQSMYADCEVLASAVVLGMLAKGQTRRVRAITW